MNTKLKVNELQKEYTAVPTVNPVPTNIMMVGDLGSTGTRTSVFAIESVNGQPKLVVGDVVEVDSAYTLTEKEVDYLQNKSNQLNDLLEIILTDISEGKVDEAKLFKKPTRILKGGIMKDFGANIEQTVSDLGKAAQPSTFVNIICNVGIQLFLQQAQKGIRHSEYHVDLTVALTTEDTQNSKSLAKFKHSLAGKYKFELPRLNYSVDIIFNESAIYIQDESMAVLGYWATMNPQEAAKYPNVLVVDGGGRSFDVGYLEEGRLVESGAKSLPFGGGRLVQDTLKDFLNTTEDTFKPNEPMIRKAIETGKVQRGGTYLPIPNNISRAKERMAKDIMKGFNDIFQVNRGMTAESISLVLTAGGCFRETGKIGDDSYVPSLTAYLQDEFKKASPYTVFDQIQESYPIPNGLVFYRISKMG